MIPSVTRRHANTALGGLIAGFLSVACGPSAPPDTRSVGTAPTSDVLPDLRPSWVTDSGQYLERLGSTVLVLADGSVVIALPSDSSRALARVFPGAEAPEHFGARGSGPGELRGAMPIGESNGVLDVFDLMQLRLHRFHDDGTVEDLQLAAPFLPRIATTVSGRSVLLGAVPGPTGSLPALLDVRTGEINPLVAPPDSFMLAHFGRIEGELRSPALGLWANGFVMGDGTNYALALYDWNGGLVRTLHRELPATQRTAAQIDRSLAGLTGRSAAQKARTKVELESTALPHFSHTAATGIDHLNRVWIVGPAGDSAYADVFSDRRFLGRIPLPCRDFSGSWSMTGQWLALVCTDPTSADGIPRVEVYRVVEPGD